MDNPAWIKNGRVFVFHERRQGQVYGHLQTPEQVWCVFGIDFVRIAEGDFERAIEDAEAFDVRTLPAYRREDP